MSDFDIQLFKQRLAETIAWCVPRFSMDDIENSLRTPPKPDFYYRDFTIIEAFANTVFEKRKANFGTLTDLAGGRLFLFYMESSTCDGVAPPLTYNFVDECNFTAWDTWVYFGVENKIYYLISWIPQPLIEDVNWLVQASAEQCVKWIEETDYPFTFLDTLKAEGLFTK